MPAAPQTPPRPIRRVLIANRGEIAVRIIRTLRDLGIESVAVYSDADAGSLHRKLADFAVRLPGNTSAETYLQVPRIIAAAQASGADALHPGYGFLSENAGFAEAVTAAGLTFIGPTAASMRIMGDKISAKHLMRKHEVPLVPGSREALKDVADLKALVAEMGFPVILKASAGGGGRGMRILKGPADVEPGFEAASREALSYFGNPAVFAERYIENPRHIEIQVLCDAHGNGVHLFERDCSVQRRHQKLIEEAPSLYLADAERRRLGEIAVRAALAAGYQGVGTVEFISESPTRTYFMEMNTRIQVEHPVTELITGMDLVAEQVRVAQGLPLRHRQEDIRIRGWAIEARINAEDPLQGFMPGPGPLTRVHWPAGPHVRVDTHTYQGYEIPAFYDSMFAKLIVWGETRDEAIARMRRALREMEVEGVPTTARFHDAVMRHPAFTSGKFDTSFVEKAHDELTAMMREAVDGGDNEAVAALSAAWLAQSSDAAAPTAADDRESWRDHARLAAARAKL